MVPSQNTSLYHNLQQVSLHGNTWASEVTTVANRALSSTPYRVLSYLLKKGL